MPPTTLATRGATWNLYEEMVVEHCCNCSMPFAMPRVVQHELLEHGSASDKPTKTFYCPAGHPQHYTGKSEAQRLRAEKDGLERRLQWARDSDERNRQRAVRAERSASALRGVVTRTKRRVGNGVCPCCNRTFSQLQRHMSTQHPDYRNDEWRWPASTSTIRRWAATEGFDVASRGRLPVTVVDAYRRQFESAEGR